MDPVKNKVLTIIVIFLFQCATNAQQTNIWKDGHLSFVTKELVDSEGYEDETDYDAENDDVGINMEIINYFNLPEDYRSLQYSSSQGCLDMEIELREKGGPFLEGYESYYSICYDNEHHDYIINAVIYRDDTNQFYDIALYCYTISIEEGLNILKSIRFLND